MSPRLTRPALPIGRATFSTTTANEQLPGLLGQKTTELADKAKNLNDLAKAAKEVGATMKTSDLVGSTGQVPDLGQVGQVAPQLFDLNVGNISGPINAGRTGVVAKLVDKQEPTRGRDCQELRPGHGTRCSTSAVPRPSTSS